MTTMKDEAEISGRKRRPSSDGLHLSTDALPPRRNIEREIIPVAEEDASSVNIELSTDEVEERSTLKGILYGANCLKSPFRGLGKKVGATGSSS